MQASIATRPASATGLSRDLAVVAKHLFGSHGGDFMRAVDELGLSLTQLKLLQRLAEADEALSVKQLADALALSLPGVSRAVDGLVRRQLVTRDEDPSDRRCRRVVVTAKGRRIVERLFALRVAGLRRFVEQLEDDEREALAAALEPIARRLS